MSYYIRKIQEGRMVTKRKRSAASAPTPSPASQTSDRRKVRSGGAGSKIGDHATLSDPGHGAGDSGVTGDARKLKSGEPSPMGNVPRDSEGRSSLRVVKRTGGVMADVATGSGNRARRRMKERGLAESYYTNRIQERRFRKQEYKASKAKAMKKSNVSDEELAEILKRTRKDQQNELDMLRKAFRVDASTKYNSNNTRLTEALYNALCDLGDLILEAYRKPKSGEKVKGRGPVKLGDMPLFLRGTSGYEGRDPMRAKARMKKNIAMQNAPEARKGTVVSKTRKHYAKLHKRANAGDAKAKELLRRAEMSDTD